VESASEGFSVRRRLGLLLFVFALSAAGSAHASPVRAPDFALRDQDGRLVRLSAERGRFVVLAFLYTHCRDVCPLVAEQLNEALRELGPARSSVRVLAVSVDPRGDTPDAVRRFVRLHRLLPQFRYLIGTRQWLEPVWRAYHLVVYPSGPDVVAHSSFELLVDRAGIERALYTSHVRAREVVRDLRALERGGTRSST
jgi:protein SCO1